MAVETPTRPEISKNKQGNRKFASMLFVDIVDFSKKEGENQIELLRCLKNAIQMLLHEYEILEKNSILKLTGDGFLLICHDNVNEDILKIAIDLQLKLKEQGVLIRQGINVGYVYIYDDINDAIGVCINNCQRIMDFGDANHILLSTSTKDTELIESKQLKENRHKIGCFYDKHKNEIDVYNYYCIDNETKVGNPDTPQNLSFNYKGVAEFSRTGSWKRLLSDCEIVDLTHDINNELPMTFKSQRFCPVTVKVERGMSIGITFNTTRILDISMNHGTHIDFPSHIANLNDVGGPIGKYPVKNFIGEVLVFDASEKVKKFADCMGFSEITKSLHLIQDDMFYEKLDKSLDILAINEKEFTKECGKDIEGKVIIIYTGLDKLWTYGEKNAWEYLYFFNPYIEYELAKHFVDKKISLLGVDALQIEDPIINFDIPDEPDELTEALKVNLTSRGEELIGKRLKKIKKIFIHKLLLSNQILLIENMKNVDKLLNKQSLFIAPPLKLTLPNCSDNSITRAFAIVFKEKNNEQSIS